MIRMLRSVGILDVMLGVLLVTVLVGYALSTQRAHQLKSVRLDAQSQLLELVSQLEAYKHRTGRYPQSLSDLSQDRAYQNPTLQWHAYTLYYSPGDLIAELHSEGWTLTAVAQDRQSADHECQIMQYDSKRRQKPAKCWQSLNNLN